MHWDGGGSSVIARLTAVLLREIFSSDRKMIHFMVAGLERDKDNVVICVDFFFFSFLSVKYCFNFLWAKMKCKKDADLHFGCLAFFLPKYVKKLPTEFLQH